MQHSPHPHYVEGHQGFAVSLLFTYLLQVQKAPSFRVLKIKDF